VCKSGELRSSNEEMEPESQTIEQRLTIGEQRSRKLRGDESSRIWSLGTLMQVVPHILSCFSISSTRLLASQCGKISTNPVTLSEYSLFFKSTSSAVITD